MVKILMENGFSQVSGGGKGSHRKFLNPVTNKTAIVPHHLNDDLGAGIWNKILKDAGLR